MDKYTYEKAFVEWDKRPFYRVIAPNGNHAYVSMSEELAKRFTREKNKKLARST